MRDTHGGYFDTVRFVALSPSECLPSVASTPPAALQPVVMLLPAVFSCDHQNMMQGNDGTRVFQAGTVVSLPYYPR